MVWKTGKSKEPDKEILKLEGCRYFSLKHPWNVSVSRVVVFLLNIAFHPHFAVAATREEIPHILVSWRIHNHPQIRRNPTDTFQAWAKIVTALEGWNADQFSIEIAIEKLVCAELFDISTRSPVPTSLAAKDKGGYQPIR